MSIYTRRGDHGETSIADGSRIGKASARVEAYGAVDEACCHIGFASAAAQPEGVGALLEFAGQRLANCAASLAQPESGAAGHAVADEDVQALEEAIDRFEAETGPLKGFITMSGSEAATRLSVARAVVRRAERRIVALHRSQPVDPAVLAFVNRLSDALFAAARYSNTRDGFAERTWDPEAPRPKF